MGIINKDAFTTRYGLELTNTYISLGENNIELRKERETDVDNNVTEKYTLTGIFDIWLSKEFKNKEKSPFASHVIYKVLSTDEITTNLYNILYTDLKKKYTNTIDDL